MCRTGTARIQWQKVHADEWLADACLGNDTCNADLDFCTSPAPASTCSSVAFLPPPLPPRSRMLLSSRTLIAQNAHVKLNWFIVSNKRRHFVHRLFATELCFRFRRHINLQHLRREKSFLRLCRVNQFALPPWIWQRSDASSCLPLPTLQGPTLTPTAHSVSAARQELIGDKLGNINSMR
jgi:hypothetical protein